MITYRDVADYLLRMITEEGKTDMQNHIGTAIYNDDLLDFKGWCKTHFGAEVVRTYGNIENKENQKYLYIYYDKDSCDYAEIAFCDFPSIDCAVLDAGDGQKIALYPIAPEVCITYKQ